MHYSLALLCERNPASWNRLVECTLFIRISNYCLYIAVPPILIGFVSVLFSFSCQTKTPDRAGLYWTSVAARAHAFAIALTTDLSRSLFVLPLMSWCVNLSTCLF